MEDNEIIALFNERSQRAIDIISAKYGRISLKIAENILKSREDAEECVNDAYIVLWEKIPPLSPSPICAYLFKVVRNQALKRYHKNTALKRNSYYDVTLSELENVLFSDDSAESEIISEQIAEAINSFLENISSDKRIMFVRRYFYGDSIKEISSLTGFSSHYISVSLSRIREDLRKFLIKEELI